VEYLASSIKRVLRPVSLLAGLVLPGCVSQAARGDGDSQLVAEDARLAPVATSDPKAGEKLSSTSPSGQAVNSSINGTTLGDAFIKGINRPLRDLEAAWNDPRVVLEAATDGLLDAAVRQARGSVMQELAGESDPQRQLELRELLLPRVREYSWYRHRDVLTDREGKYESWRPALDGLEQFSFGIVDDRADSIRFRLKTPSGSWALRTLSGDCSFGDYCSRIGASVSFSLECRKATSLTISGDSTGGMVELVTIF
jgi:hypothetical protein